MENKRVNVNRFKKRKKPCFFTKNKINYINYKDVEKLKEYISANGQILTRRVSGNCSFHQRMMTMAIKRARTVALLPYLVK